MKEVIALSMPLLETLQEEWLIVPPAILTVFASLFGVNETASEFIKRGGKVRVIVNISYQYIEPVREMIAIGEEVRHIDQPGIMFEVFDKKVCISAINAEIERVSLTAPISGIWTDDPVYAHYLTSTFEMLWNQAIDADVRIQQLLKEGPL